METASSDVDDEGQFSKIGNVHLKTETKEKALGSSEKTRKKMAHWL